MRYTFGCLDCGDEQQEVMTVAAYEVAMQTERGVLTPPDRVATGLACDQCGSPKLVRESMGDMRAGQYTEKQMFWDDATSPDELKGKGGYSRERKRILDAAGLQQKDSGKTQKKPRGPSSYFRRDRAGR